MLQLTAVGIVTSATPYLVTRAFKHGEGDIGTALLAMLSATTVSVVFWAWAGRRFGERRALLVAVLFFGAAASLLGLAAIGSSPWNIAIAAFILAGIPFAGMQVLPFTILAHLIHAERERSSRAEGAYTGVWTAAEKLGLALGPMATGIVLALSQGDIVHGLTRFVATAPLLLAIVSLPLFAMKNFRVRKSTQPER